MMKAPAGDCLMSSSPFTSDALRAVIARHWGFDTLRPLQDQAMRAALDGRDSLVVLPTGGGKSLCYQAPAVLRGGTTVVVSPLIALMKDQVDGLLACGIAAAQLDSSQSTRDRNHAEAALRPGGILISYLPTIGQVMRLREELDTSAFGMIETIEVLQRSWHVEGQSVRPDHRMVAHTGFLTAARLIEAEPAR